MGNLATGGVTGRDLAIGRANLVTGRANLVTARAKLVTGRINLVTGKVVPTSSRTNQTKSNRKFAASGPNPPPHPRSLQPPRRNQRRHHHGSTLKKSSSSTSNFWNGEIADCFLSKRGWLQARQLHRPSTHTDLRHDSREASASSAMRVSARRSRLQSSRLIFCITIT